MAVIKKENTPTLKDGAGVCCFHVDDSAAFETILPYYLNRCRTEGIAFLRVHFVDTDAEEAIAEEGAIRIPLQRRFEDFTVTLIDFVRAQKEDTFYIFDSLSELQTAWATDLMIGNFFRVIAPILRERATGALFPLYRGMHADRTLSSIRGVADLTIDVFADKAYLFADDGDPYFYDEESQRFLPVADDALRATYEAVRKKDLEKGASHGMDFWDRFFEEAKEAYEEGRDTDAYCERMCRIMMTRDEKIRKMIIAFFDPRDYFHVKDHMIGTGLIGGKACGMLAARRIIKARCPDIYRKFERHDSFYIGSDVFYSYIVENGIFDLRVRQRKEEEYFALADTFQEKLLHGEFSEEMEEGFRALLREFCDAPIIVRSSSILEDGFGNAFAGKYESVFLSNTGDEAKRLSEFKDAIRVVYASTMSLSALDYRKRRGLGERDEQMALLVQRVSGAAYGKYFMPHAAGVGHSYSVYRFLPSIDPAAGMLRLVMGLGASAVDRKEGAHPRLVTMDRPEATPFRDLKDHHAHSQRMCEIVDLTKSGVDMVPVEELIPHLTSQSTRALFSHDTEAERRLRERGRRADVVYVSLGGLVRNQRMMSDMRRILRTLQEVYDHPVDIEFTINLGEEDTYRINVLQCRALQALKEESASINMDAIDPEKIALDVWNASMGKTLLRPIDYLVYVDPLSYYELPYDRKSSVARVIGRLDRALAKEEGHVLLMVPGRIGTSSPELGVPTTYADISGFFAVIEMEESRAGYDPELSYGSHIFQDLVENHILYGAVLEGASTRVFLPERLTAGENILPKILPEDASFADVIRCIDWRDAGMDLYHDMAAERLVLTVDTHVL